MKLSKLIEELNVSAISDLIDRDIAGINHDSKKIENGFLYVAVRGYELDGHNFVQDAINRGATAIVTEEELAINDNIAQIVVKNSRIALSKISNQFFDNPSGKIKVIGVTGTNGKTTVTYLVKSIVESMLQKNCQVNTPAKASTKTGLLGTINYCVGSEVLPARETTPGAVESQKFLSQMVEQGIEFAVMEVSSQALVQHRVDDIGFSLAIFTNLTPEHLDYHITFENYRDAKCRLFENLDEHAVAILNADDEAGEYFAENTKANVIWYGIKNSADVNCRISRFLTDSTVIVVSNNNKEIEIELPLIGLHNVYNALAAISCGIVLGIDLETIRDGISLFKNVPGRLEVVDCGRQFKVYIDYAHTEHALQEVLRSLNQIKLKNNRLLLVFGCGGDRDKDKRAAMGKVAEQLADKLWITNDNPRSEDPLMIIDDIVKGFRSNVNYCVQPDRRAAIRDAMLEAKRDDMVLIAGKGHEREQIVGGTVLKFNDREVVEDIFSQLILNG